MEEPRPSFTARIRKIVGDETVMVAVGSAAAFAGATVVVAAPPAAGTEPLSVYNNVAPGVAHDMVRLIGEKNRPRSMFVVGLLTKLGTVVEALAVPAVGRL